MIKLNVARDLMPLTPDISIKGFNIGCFLSRVKELHAVSRALNRLDVYRCNKGTLTDKELKRHGCLLSKADLLAKSIGMAVYYQSDPRGCSLYLCPIGFDERQYTSGVPLGVF